MYQFYENTLTIPGRALYEDLGVMSESNYKKQCSLGKLNKVRTARGLDNIALVEFDTLPERFKIEVVRKLGFPPKKEAQHQILKYYKDDFEAMDFFANFLLADYRTLSDEKQDEYVKNAQMLWAMNTYIKERKSFRKARGGNNNLTQIWIDTTAAVVEVQERVGHTLPKSERRLREKLKTFLEDGYSSLVSEKFGNQNTVKVKESQQEALLRNLFRRYQNFDNEAVARDYNLMASAIGWEPITGSTAANYRKKFGLSVHSFANGSKKFENLYQMQVTRKKPEFALAYWTLDGWNAELLYQKFDDGKTTYHNRLTIVVVLDASCNYPVGYAIGERENTALIKAALRDAVNHTEKLFGYKHKAYQVQADNYAAKTMAPIYRGVAKKYQPTKVGNAKAKIIEPWFNWFNDTYCRREPNWSGHGVKSKNQPNPDYLQKNRKNFPTEEQAYEQLERLAEAARAEALDKFLEKYNQAPDDLKEPLSDLDFYKFLGVKKPDTTKYKGEGMVFQIEKQKYFYESFQLEFRENIHLDWQIFFDPQNMDKVLAYNEDRQLNFTLEEKYIQPMDLYSQEREDQEQLNRGRTFNRFMQNYIMEAAEADYEEMDSLLSDKKIENETLEKILLTDSLGQHKDQKRAKIQKTAQKVLKNEEKKQDQRDHKTWSDQQREFHQKQVDINKFFEND